MAAGQERGGKEAGYAVESPSARIVAAGNALFAVEDAAGRRILLRRLGVLDQLRLFKALGPMLVENRPYLAMARIAAAVVEIDGHPTPPAMNEASLEDTISRLGESGLDAVARALRADAAVPESHAGN